MLANFKSHLVGNDGLLAGYPETIYPIRQLEAAQILGHIKADVTQVYAERDIERTGQVALKVG